MAKEVQYGLFVEGADKPAVTSDNADLLARLRTDPEFRTARTKVARADADASRLFPSNTSGPDTTGLQLRKAQLRSEMEQERIDEQLKSEIKAEGLDKETLTALEESEDDDGDGDAPEVTKDTAKIEGPHNAAGETGETLAEVDSKTKPKR